MERILYLNERFCAVSEDGRLVEYLPAAGEERCGEILLGRVERLMASLQCAFVDIGRRKSGFLPLTENSKSFQGPPIRSGEEIPVQIRREETGGKGAYLSRDLTLAGKYLLLMPCNRHIGVSARIREEADRERLTALGRELAAGRFGLVLRASALDAEREELREEMNLLWDRWQRALARDGGRPADRILLRGNTAEEDLLNDYGPRGIDRVIRGEEWPTDLERQRAEANNRRVRLPHGGNLVIDPCEALTVIDVNSASDGRGLSKRETVLETNLEACREIAIQTRLRNLSGILILDLIDMAEEADRLRVLAELERAFAGDRVKTVIHGLTRLGLVEMTRKRTAARPDGSSARRPDGEMPGKDGGKA